MEVQSGTLSFGGAYIQTGGATILAGGAVAVAGTLDIRGGRLAGAGTITGNVANAGQVDPGSAGSAGLLTITGTYTQTATGTLDVEIGGLVAGTQYDQLRVTGAATLGGALNVTQVNGFTRTAGDTFTAMTYAVHGTSSFGAIFGGGLFLASVGATSVTLQSNAPLGTPPSGTVQGTVFAADGLTPVPSAPVEIFDVASDALLASRTADAAGAYQAPGLTPGTQGFRVRVTSPHDPTVVSERTATFPAEGAIVTVDLTLPVSVVRGTVVFANGLTAVPFPSVFITQGGSGAVRSFFATSTDASGGYLVVGPAVGDVVVTAQDPGSGLTGTAAGTLASLATPVTLNVALQPSGTVTGTVLDAASNAVPFASVAVASAATTFTRLATADAQGGYLLDRIALGAFTVQAKPPDRGVTATAVARLAVDGETATVSPSLPATGTVTGTVLDVDGVTPKAGVSATVETYDHSGPLGLFQASVVTDPSGSYQVPGVPAGPVRATASSQPAGTPPAPGSPAPVYGYGEGALGAAATVAIPVVLGTAVPFDQTLDGGDGFRYDVTCRGELLDGGTADRRLTDAYTHAALLRVNGPTLPCVSAARLEDGGREVVVGPAGVGGLTVTRKVFVPAAGGFARYLELLQNPTAAPLTATVEVRSTLGSDTATQVIVAPAATGNTFAVTSGTGACCRPALAHVFGGPGGRLAVAATQFANGNGVVFYRWEVTVPAGGSAIVMHFAVQREPADAAGAHAQAVALATLSEPNALAGMSLEERAQVFNFSVP